MALAAAEREALHGAMERMASHIRVAVAVAPMASAAKAAVESSCMCAAAAWQEINLQRA